jgi:hypothetical protein
MDMVAPALAQDANRTPKSTQTPLLPDLIDRMIDSALNRGNYAAQRYLCDRILGRTTTPDPPLEPEPAEKPDRAEQPI